MSDLTDAATFSRWWFGDAPGVYSASWTDGWSGEAATSIDDLGRLIDREERSQRRGTYFRTTTLKAAPAMGKRGLAVDTFAVPGYWSDQDRYSPGGAHARTDLPKTLEEALAPLRAAGYPHPSCIIDTGHGWSFWWRFTAPWLLDGEDFAAADARLKTFGSGLGRSADAVFDFARVMRAPGTTNRKLHGDPRQVQIVEWSGQEHDRGDLDRIAATAAAARPVGEATGRPAAPTGLSGVVSSGDPYQRRYAIAEVEKWLGYVANHPGPGRQFERPKSDGSTVAVYYNEQLRDTAGRVGRFVPALLSYEDAWDRIREAVRATFDDLDDNDKATMRRNLAKGMREPYEVIDDLPAPHTGMQGLVATTAAPPLSQPGDRPRAEEPKPTDEPKRGRRVDLAPYMEGTVVVPDPTYGGWRDDGRQMLYPGRWHTVVALNSAGKSWFALWHCLEELRRGSTVAYLHFEETSPLGTIERLRALGAKDEWIRERFIWFDAGTRWAAGEFAQEYAALPAVPHLLVLDGINAACSQHGWPVNDPIAVGTYRSTFVAPATAVGTSVLSLGHPPKSRDRQDERHGFGSTAWLDEVEGVGFRLEASRKNPIGLGKVGYTTVWSVKDRYGQVDAIGLPVAKGESTWRDLGALQLDSTEVGRTEVRMLRPKTQEERETTSDAIAELAKAIVTTLQARPTGSSYSSQADLKNALRAAAVKFDDRNVAPATERLFAIKVLAPLSGPRNAMGGVLTSVPMPGQEDRG